MTVEQLARATRHVFDQHHEPNRVTLLLYLSPELLSWGFSGVRTGHTYACTAATQLSETGAWRKSAQLLILLQAPQNHTYPQTCLTLYGFQSKPTCSALQLI